MFRMISLLTAMFIPFLASAGSRDVKVYRGTSRYSSDILFTIDSPLTVE